jgi:molecular chaperone IbpA
MTHNKTLTLRSFDIPQLHKFGIGFDSLFDDLQRFATQSSTNYPPHNVIKTGENTVLIEVAVAGFAEGEVDLQVNKNMLTIKGEQQQTKDTEWEYLHRGISSRDFTHSFTLADHVEVKSASITNGILSVYLERQVPEEARPKSIAITYNK